MKKVFQFACLLLVIAFESGCASSKAETDDYSPALEPVPTHDDSHGWGASFGKSQ